MHDFIPNRTHLKSYNQTQETSSIISSPAFTTYIKNTYRLLRHCTPQAIPLSTGLIIVTKCKCAILKTNGSVRNRKILPTGYIESSIRLPCEHYRIIINSLKIRLTTKRSCRFREASLIKRTRSLSTALTTRVIFIEVGITSSPLPSMVYFVAVN